jgi:hypothetical protein
VSDHPDRLADAPLGERNREVGGSLHSTYRTTIANVRIIKTGYLSYNTVVIDERWHSKWHRYSQPPSFYFSFHEALGAMSEGDLRLQAARLSPTATIVVPREPEVSISKLLSDPEKAEKVLSSACIAVFSGNTEVR